MPDFAYERLEGDMLSHPEFFRFRPFDHLEVKADGKIWIQRDGTDFDLRQTLIDQGVPRNEIVLAFKPLHWRPMPGFAEA